MSEEIYAKMKDFFRSGTVSEFHAEEWLKTNKFTGEEYKAIATVLYERNDIDQDALVEILVEALGQDAVTEWMKAYIADTIRPGRGEYPGITKEQTEKALILAFQRKVIPYGDAEYGSEEALRNQWQWVIYRLDDALKDKERVTGLVRYAVQRIREVVDEDVTRPKPVEPPASEDSRPYADWNWIKGGPDGRNAVVTHGLISVEQSGGNVRVELDGSIDHWPSRSTGADIKGLLCAFVLRDGVWTGGYFEQHRGGAIQTRPLTNLLTPYLEITPQSGEVVRWLVISADGRQATNYVETTWP